MLVFVCGDFDPDVFNSELFVGWVDPRVELGWVGLEFLGFLVG